MAAVYRKVMQRLSSPDDKHWLASGNPEKEAASDRLI
jgi:hypothetical protein